MVVWLLKLMRTQSPSTRLRWGLLLPGPTFLPLISWLSVGGTYPEKEVDPANIQQHVYLTACTIQKWFHQIWDAGTTFWYLGKNATVPDTRASPWYYTHDDVTSASYGQWCGHVVVCWIRPPYCPCYPPLVARRDLAPYQEHRGQVWIRIMLCGEIIISPSY